MAEFPLVPAHTALINVDMQNCFVEDSPLASPDGPAVLHRINRLAEACRSAGVLVVAVPRTRVRARQTRHHYLPAPALTRRFSCRSC